MKYSRTLELTAALGLALLAGPSHAVVGSYAFQIDSFWVFKNIDPAVIDDPAALLAVQPVFVDHFDNGRVPPNDNTPDNTLFFTNGTPASYGVSGTVGPEADGRLTLDSGGFVDNGYGTLRSNVNLNTNNNNTSDPNDPNYSLGLKAWNDNFFVVGVWDFVNPGNGKGSYGVRFNDSSGGVTGNDVVSLAVQGATNGGAVISFLHFNNVDGTSTVLDRAVLETHHQQIALGLGYLDTDGNGTKEVSAGYFFIDNGMPGPLITSDASIQIFHDENWTRAAFYAADTNPVPIPEPSEYALMLAGLGLVGLAARRRRA